MRAERKYRHRELETQITRILNTPIFSMELRGCLEFYGFRALNI